MGVTAFAPAKVNLYLHIVSRRADGYHLVDSLVAFADIGDRVTAEPAAALSLEVSGPEAAALEPVGHDNLVLRAARLLTDYTGVIAGAALHLEKNLPVAAGIGGGSSDAAAALLALRQLWQVPIDDEGLRELGANVTHLGPLGAGQTAKIINQAIVGAGFVVLAEALAIAEAAGIDAAALPRGLAGGFALSFVTVVLCLLIITIPFGVACFRLAAFVLWPFGRAVVPRPEAGAPSVLGNILWYLAARALGIQRLEPFIRRWGRLNSFSATASPDCH